VPGARAQRPGSGQTMLRRRLRRSRRVF
jgi:hypothetical protein